MTRTVYKYPLMITDRQSIAMPTGAEILSVGIDPQGNLCLWVLVDPTLGPLQMNPFIVHVIGTGNRIPDAHMLKFVGSVTMSPFVWHVFVR